MNFLKEGKTNWKYILIVLILAVIVGGGILIYQCWWIPIVKKPTLLPEVYKKSSCYCNSASDCYENLGVESEDQYWECSKNKCFYRCKETAPLSPPEKGVVVEPPLCVLIGIGSIGLPPSLKGGKIEDNSVLLEWSSASEENTMEFNVYRKIASEEDISSLDNKTLAPDFWEIKKPENLYDVIKNENVTSFVDQKVESEKTYLYAITGTDRFCHEGNFLEFVVVTFPNEIKIWKIGGEMVTIWKVEIQEIEIAETETSDWQTFKNEVPGYEFEIKYPSDWGIIRDDVPILAFQPIVSPLPENITITVGLQLLRPGTFSLNNFLKKPKEIYINNARYYFEDEAFYHEDLKTPLRVRTFIITNLDSSKVVIIQLMIRGGRQTKDYYLPDTEISDELNILNKMVSTFRFIEDETANWKTYRNEKIGIEFQYPEKIFANPYTIWERDDSKGIIFSNKELYDAREYTGLYFNAYSPSYKVIPPGFGVFTGAENILSYCPEPSKTIQGGGGWRMCKIIEIAGQKAIFETFASNYECGTGFWIHVYFNNQSDSAYKGLVFVLMKLDAVSEALRFMPDCIGGGNQEKFESDFYNQSINIMENKNLSEKDMAKLKAFNQMLSTFRFLE